MRSTSSPDQINLCFDIGPEPAPDAVKVEAVQGQSESMPVDLPESAWVTLDRKILKSAASPVMGSVLYEKSRHSNLGRKYFYPRRDYLVAQGKLYTWTEISGNNNTTTYYCVNPPSKPEPAPAVADVEPVEFVEVVDQIGAIVPVANTLASPDTVQNLLLDQHDHEFLEHFRNPDDRMFLVVCTSAAQKIGRTIDWVEFGGRLWLTVKQSANLLGMDERTVQHHLQRFPFEMSVLSEKLTGNSLNAYKQCYPPNPTEPPQSGCGGSVGLGRGQNEKAVHGHSSHFILISPAGVTWLAKASETRPAKAIIKEFMIKADKVAPAMEHMRGQSANALAPEYQVMVDLLVDLKEGNRKIVSLLNAMVPAATRTEEGIGEVRETLVTVGHQMNTVVKKLKAEREPFRDSVKREAARIFLKIHPDGRDIFDNTLIIDPKTGGATKACDFDHFNLEGKQRQDGTIRNCAPLSRDTHRRKHGNCSDPFTVDEWQKFKNFHGAWQHHIDTEERCKPYQPGLSLETQL